MNSALIAAIATPAGVGGIAIVRLSGAGAWDCVQRLFTPAKPLCWDNVPGYSLHYGHLVADGRVYDEVLLALMKEDRSYTGEEMAEIQCHGGSVVARDILELLLRHGALPAERGEFTKRAFLSGRLDLSRAEGVRETIEAIGRRDLDFSLRRLRGDVESPAARLRDRLLNAIAAAEAVIDFPEDGLDDSTAAALCATAQEISAALEHEIAKAERGRLFREGVATAIVGCVNVGKSSLLNALLGRERAIVTDLPGTTRDTIEETVVLGELPLRLIDTAGIRRAQDPVEAEGVERSRAALRASGLILFLFDGHLGFTPADEALFAELGEAPVIVLANKADLGLRVDTAALAARLHCPVLPFSAKDGQGVEELTAQVARFFLGGTLVIDESEWVGNLRHRDSFMKAREHLQALCDTAADGLPLDLLLVDAYAAVQALGEIGGENVGEDVLDRIFSQFCIGK